VARTHARPIHNGSRLAIFKGLLFTIVAVGVWLIVNVDNLHEFMATYQKREKEREDIEKLKQTIKKLKRQQQSLAYNGAESEKQIRERMGLHLPGEKVLFVKEEVLGTEKAPETTSVQVGLEEEPSADAPEPPAIPGENKAPVNKRKRGQ